ncbi:LCP family protein [Amycolatopsis sp. NBC_01307]|uniref:LCP family protein n=1 Tax=Amycolatopsis sp. NBC_01307 TaxID=2903561 RepID=UPI002E137EC0|nr:LCP family protein [Amycolatopsis sp. NBC_01307]
MHQKQCPNRTRRRRRPLLVAGKVFAGAASAVVLVCTGIAATTAGSLLDGVQTSEALAGGAHSTGGALNILLIGLDSRKDQNGDMLPPEILDQLHAGDGTEGGYNTNTLILLHLPAGGGRATAVSIPRDDYVAVRGIPGRGHAKIKEAYGLAKFHAETALRQQGVTAKTELESRGREAGRRETLQTVRDFLDVPIDRFAEVNLAGFYDLADALGGVEVCLNHPVRDSYSGADFPAGRQVLDGARALAFVRQRHGLANGDLDRTRRQQAFLASVTHKLRDAGTFTDFGKLSALIETAQQDVVVSAGWDLLAFVQQARDLTGGNLEFSTLPIEGFATVDGQAVNEVDVEKVRATVRQVFEPTAEAPRSIADVLNASGRVGLAASAADVLGQHGFREGAVGSSRVRRTTVDYGHGAAADALLAAKLLGGLPVRATGSVAAGHVRVILGADFALPAPADRADAAVAPGTRPPDGTVDGGGIPCVD